MGGIRICSSSLIRSKTSSRLRYIYWEIGELNCQAENGNDLFLPEQFYTNHLILVLDEATSALDTESEVKIQKAIEVVVIDKGEIIQVGEYNYRDLKKFSF